MEPEDVTPCTVEPGEHQDVGTGRQVGQPVGDCAVERDPRVGRPLVALPRRRVPVEERGFDPADGPDLVTR
jgi:hypothetical protein